MDPDTGVNRCVRSAEIYDAIVCPEGKFLRSQEDVLNGCKDRNIECAEGFQCLCTPCVAAFEVDVFPITENESSSKTGCSKFSVCGSVTQGEHAVLRLIDNKKRDRVEIVVNILDIENTLKVNLTCSRRQRHPYERDIVFDASNRSEELV